MDVIAYHFIDNFISVCKSFAATIVNTACTTAEGESGLPGDINGDGSTTVQDLILVVLQVLYD